MFGVGHAPELIILLVIAVLILGPGKLPSVGSAVGRSIREFKRETSEITSHFNDHPTVTDRDHTNQA